MSTPIDPSTMQPLSPYAARLEIERDDLRAENARLRDLLAECATDLDDGAHGRLLLRVRAALGETAFADGQNPLSETRTAAKRAREVLIYCKLWTDGDVETLHLRPERKVLEHRISVISGSIQMLDDALGGDRPDPALGCANVEKAWREGYAAGYDNGSDDASAYERGTARHSNTKRRALEEAWNDSETKAATHPPTLGGDRPTLGGEGEV